MERFLHPGRQTVASVYGPICFGPLPVVAFQRSPDGSLRLAASGALFIQQKTETCGRKADRRSGCDEKEGENFFCGSIMTSGSLKISQSMVGKC